MGRVVICHFDEAASVVRPTVRGFHSDERVHTSAVLTGADRPIHLWKHDVAAGGCLSLDRPEQDHCLYVLAGDIIANDCTVGAGAMVGAEHLSRAVVSAGASGASLLHFHRPDGHMEKPKRAGGNVHVVGREGIATHSNAPRQQTATLLAGADCPTCELWLHAAFLGQPYAQKGTLHYHTSDEVIVVLDGKMRIGNRELGRGSVLAVDANTRYGFGAGQSGLSFINFRPGGSHIHMVEGDLLSKAPIDERSFYSSGTAA